MNKKEIKDLVKPYASPSNSRAVWQIINTVIPYLASIVGMYYMITSGLHYGLVFIASIIPALLLVRIFILFHDCTHRSFMKSRTWMNILGHVFGIMTFTSFHRWQREHNKHHSTVGNIDKRGIGDVWTMTVQEYKDAKWYKKLGYRLYRNPIILFVIGPIYVFVVSERLPFQNKTLKDWLSNSITNIGVIAIIITVWLTVGLKYYFMIQIPIIFFASSAGVWLFFVQHQYEDVYWADNENWDITEAALKGSSVYRLPRLLDWFTGYIGYHNVHHLNAKVPNYRLKKLYHSSKLLQSKREITLWKSFKLMNLFLYDVEHRKLITRRRYKKTYA